MPATGSKVETSFDSLHHLERNDFFLSDKKEKNESHGRSEAELDIWTEYFLLLTALFCPLSHLIIIMTLWTRQGSNYYLYLTGEEEEISWAKVTFQDPFEPPLSFIPPRHTSMKWWLIFRLFGKKILSHWLHSPRGQQVEASTEILRTLLRISGLFFFFFAPPLHGKSCKDVLLGPWSQACSICMKTRGFPNQPCPPRSGTVLGAVDLNAFSFQLQGWLFTPRSRGLKGITVHPSITPATLLRNSSMAGKVGINRKWLMGYKHMALFTVLNSLYALVWRSNYARSN